MDRSTTQKRRPLLWVAAIGLLASALVPVVLSALSSDSELATASDTAPISSHSAVIDELASKNDRAETVPLEMEIVEEVTTGPLTNPAPEVEVEQAQPLDQEPETDDEVDDEAADKSVQQDETTRQAASTDPPENTQGGDPHSEPAEKQQPTTDPPSTEEQEDPADPPAPYTLRIEFEVTNWHADASPADFLSVVYGSHAGQDAAVGMRHGDSVQSYLEELGIVVPKFVDRFEFTYEFDGIVCAHTDDAGNEIRVIPRGSRSGTAFEISTGFFARQAEVFDAYGIPYGADVTCTVSYGDSPALIYLDVISAAFLDATDSFEMVILINGEAHSIPFDSQTSGAQVLEVHAGHYTIEVVGSPGFETTAAMCFFQHQTDDFSGMEIEFDLRVDDPAYCSFDLDTSPA